jgi:acyl carrier protein
MVSRIRRKIIYKIIRELVAQKISIPISEISMWTNLKADLEIDSLEQFELAHLAMNEFKLTFFEVEIFVRLKTVKDIVYYIDQISPKNVMELLFVLFDVIFQKNTNKNQHEEFIY